jgi:sterol desaturase/sphingolipid hydroxylase (fatty acid hydroxylase superfamily)
LEWWIPAFRGTEAAVILAVLWTLEGLWPLVADRHGRTIHYAGNIALGLLNAAVTSALFATLLHNATATAAAADFGLLRWTGLNGWMGWAAALLLFDGWQYLWHRLNHRVPLLWRFHAVHHCDTEINASTALRFHVVEVALSSITRLAVLPLLGMELRHLVAYELVLLPVILVHHSNLRVPKRIDHAFRIVIVTPRVHWVHHSEFQPETDSNYSSVLSIWDWLFRTFRLRSNAEEIRLGLEDFEEREWRGALNALKIPFTHRFRARNR